MEEMITFLDLPNEMIIAILNELYLSQLIECRSICKRIKFIIDLNLKSIIDSNFKKKLFIYHPNSFCLFNPYKNFYYCESINFKNSFKSYKLDKILSSSFFCDFFINLKELYLINSTRFNLDLLNKFNGLETLFLRKFASYKDETIKLPNLKNFFLLDNFTLCERAKVHKIKVESKIERLWLENYYNEFEFVHPNQIKHIDVHNVRYSDLNLALFENLETLNVHRYV